MYTRSSLGVKNAIRLLEGDDPNVNQNSRLPFKWGYFNNLMYLHSTR